LSGFGVVYFFAVQSFFRKPSEQSFFCGCQQQSSLYNSGLWAVVSFFCHRFGKQAGCLTQHAPDVWESVRFMSIFLASVFFYISNIVHAHTRVTPIVSPLRWKENDSKDFLHVLRFRQFDDVMFYSRCADLCH
jgi:hypothetical protein